MDLKDRISKLGDYFKGFNVDSETAYLVVSFPNGWKILNEEELNETYNVYTRVVDGNTYFVTDADNGIDCLFDGVFEVISINKETEERERLFKTKCKELSELFVSEPIEKLRNITFSFDVVDNFTEEAINPLKTNKKTVKTKTTNKVEKDESIDNNTTKDNESSTIQEEENKHIQQSEIKDSKQKDSKNMAFLKKIVNKK